MWSLLVQVRLMLASSLAVHEMVFQQPGNDHEISQGIACFPPTIMLGAFMKVKYSCIWHTTAIT